MAIDLWDRHLWQVVSDPDHQPRLWPSAHPLPGGWSDHGFTGSRSACRAHLDTLGATTGGWRQLVSDLFG